MGDVKKLELKPAKLEEVKLPDWVEKAIHIGFVAAAAALAEGLAKWASAEKK